MKMYTEFLVKNLSNEIDSLCGSDGVFILDARNRITTQMRDSQKRMDILKESVHPGIIGFQIVCGERFSNDNTIVYREVSCGDGKKIEHHSTLNV